MNTAINNQEILEYNDQEQIEITEDMIQWLVYYAIFKVDPELASEITLALPACHSEPLIKSGAGSVRNLYVKKDLSLRSR